MDDKLSIPAAETTAEAQDAGTPPELLEQPREALPPVASSNRLLWTGVAVAIVGHLLPFLYFGKPDPLGEGVLTEAIAVELIDAATLDGRDQTPPSKPAPASPPAQEKPQQQSPPGPPQQAQKAIPPSPPPAPAVPPAAASVTPPPTESAKALPAFDGANDVSKASKDDAKQKQEPKQKPAEEPKPQERKPQETQPEEAQPQAPQPKRPPPQEAVAPRAQAAPPPAAKPAPPKSASSPAQAKSGEVTKFNKEVVAALAKAKPNAPGIKGSVTITVVVNYGGGVRLAKIVQSSGRDDLDKLALEAAKLAKVPPPPPDATTDDYFYDVEYKFE